MEICLSLKPLRVLTEIRLAQISETHYRTAKSHNNEVNASVDRMWQHLIKTKQRFSNLELYKMGNALENNRDFYRNNLFEKCE